MLPLIIAALGEIMLHLGIAGTQLRDRTAQRTGNGVFRALFSGLSVLNVQSV
jgi:hypothetical protein